MKRFFILLLTASIFSTVAAAQTPSWTGNNSTFPFPVGETPTVSKSFASNGTCAPTGTTMVDQVGNNIYPAWEDRFPIVTTGGQFTDQTNPPTDTIASTLIGNDYVPDYIQASGYDVTQGNRDFSGQILAPLKQRVYFQGSISANVLTVAALTGNGPVSGQGYAPGGIFQGSLFPGTIAIQQRIIGLGMQPDTVQITGQLSGTPGGIGTYSVSGPAQTIPTEMLEAFSPANDYIDHHVTCYGNTTNHYLGTVSLSYHPFGPNPAHTVIVDHDAGDVASGLTTSISNAGLTISNVPDNAVVAEIVFGIQAIGVDACTWTPVGGSALPMTLITSENSTDPIKGRVELWGIVGVPSGDGTVNCAWANASYAYLDATALVQVNQSSPFVAETPANGVGLVASLTASSAAGQVVIGAMAGGTNIISEGPQQLFIDNTGFSPAVGAAMAAPNASPSVMLNWSMPYVKYWAIAAVGVQPD